MFTVKWEARSSDEREGKEILDSEKKMRLNHLVSYPIQLRVNRLGECSEVGRQNLGSP